ncbi:MAG: amidophosphoribosyltransferase [Candidatus Gracilibacteria bacterium]|nr:amidophosphoribosyltransferase [Candidatus Gracilibacteria bacterium]
MCGIIGTISNGEVAADLYDGLLGLQHRGQDACGMVTFFDNKFKVRKGTGLVREVFSMESLLELRGQIGIGHVRYPTAGARAGEAEVQPFLLNSPYGLALAHNGNLTNADKLRQELEKKDYYFNSSSDSEVLLTLLADELRSKAKKTLKNEPIFAAVAEVMQKAQGSYSVVVLIANFGLLAFRDPAGIRPLIFCERATGFAKESLIASEPSAATLLGYDNFKDVEAGEAILIDLKGNLEKKQLAKAQHTPCIFEYVYLARPDSVLDKLSVYKARLRMGEKLAKQILKSELEIDVVVPVPDSSTTAAITLAYNLGIKYREGLVKNRYIGRTFIMPGQEIRKKSIRHKLTSVDLELKGKKVLLVDDSIVRGNTSARIVEMVRKAGAEKVYFASAAPPLKWPCFYGVDFPTRAELVAAYRSLDEIKKELGVDALFYQTLEDLKAACGEGRTDLNPHLKGFCAACFDGNYPLGKIDVEAMEKEGKQCGI